MRSPKGVLNSYLYEKMLRLRAIHTCFEIIRVKLIFCLLFSDLYIFSLSLKYALLNVKAKLKLHIQPHFHPTYFNTCLIIKYMAETVCPC